MNFEYEWINRLEQFGATDITIVIRETSGAVPDRRIERHYDWEKYGGRDAINDEFLTNEANAIIAQIISDYEREQWA